MTGELIDAPTGKDGTSLPFPYLLFLGDVTEAGFAKTAFGLRDWAPDKCIGEFSIPGASVSTGLPSIRPSEAVAKGARGLLIGVANPGGVIPDNWMPALIEALEAGLDIVSGMHAKLATFPELRDAAIRFGRRLIDVRTPPSNIKVASGAPRSGKRILTVGTDCALGKKYTALAIAAGLQRRGTAADFRATGQTGIMIAGSGIPIDAVISDFLAGAAEMLSPAADEAHIDVVEGQGSLFHPSYAAVSLGLLHGSQPDGFIACHDPSRRTILGHPSYPLPSIEALILQTTALGRTTNPAIRCYGISLNTSGLAADEAESLLEEISKRHALPAADPMRPGDRFERLLDACLA